MNFLQLQRRVILYPSNRKYTREVPGDERIKLPCPYDEWV